MKVNAEVGEILLIEDNPTDVELTQRAFDRHGIKNTVHICRDGEEALEFLLGDRAAERLENLSVILLDLKLPLVDGLDVLREVKKDERTHDVPVVVLTSSREESDLVESYGLGVNSYIVKPLDFQQFTESVRVLGRYWLMINQPPVLHQATT